VVEPDDRASESCPNAEVPEHKRPIRVTVLRCITRLVGLSCQPEPARVRTMPEFLAEAR